MGHFVVRVDGIWGVQLSRNVSAKCTDAIGSRIATALDDKLAQKGIEVTAEHKQKFLKVKEAYDVLSDPKRRRLYDELGTLGDSAPWTAIWTPMWIVDLFLFITAIFFFFDKPEPPPPTEEGDVPPPPEETIPMSLKISNFITTVSFIVLQIFILMRMDKDIEWSWFKVFIPWFIYEGVNIAFLVQNAFFTTIAPPDFENLTLIVTEEGTETDPSSMVKLQQGNELLSSSFFGCLFQAIPLFMAIMLVCRLQVSSYSTFLIILPVFIFLGCCCCVMDMDSMNEELEKQRQEQQGGAGASNLNPDGTEKEYTPPNPSDVEAGNGQHTTNPSAAYGTFAAPSAGAAPVYAPPPPEESTSPLNNSNAQSDPTPYVPTVTNIDTDID
eukprot:gene29841-36962_t